jgi:peptidyl-prolyl cis-trans isomerase SurA
MKALRGTLAALVVSIFMLSGCAPKYDDQIVLEVGPGKVTMRDFENFYMRNSTTLDAARQSTPEERVKFLDLLTNYKLKLQDAYDRNLLTDPEIVGELRDYRGTLASTFIIEKEITDPGIKRLYDHRQKQIRYQHILLSMKPESSPGDTLKLYTKAMDIIRRAKGHENFDSLALKFSEHPSVKADHGDNYYITGGMEEPAIEDAVFSMQKGEISPRPVRSAFGYQIIRILDMEPTKSVRVRHIMARFQSNNPDSADQASALGRIKAVQDSLKKGREFGSLATKLSEDPGSAGQGGDLGWFERRRWVQPFDEAAFKLKAGGTSGIVKTPFGFHLLHLDSVKSLAPYSVMFSDLKKTYQQTRYGEDYTRYIDTMKKRFNYSFNESAFTEFLSHVDSSKTTDDSSWDGTLTPAIRSMALMTVNGRSIPVDSVISLLRRKQEFRSASLRRSDLKPHIDRIADSYLMEEKAVGLEERYPDFAALMKEYTDGIVLYKAEQTEVWNKAVVTDSSLRSYFSENRDKFMFPERVKMGGIEVESDTVALLVYDSLKHGADFASLASRWNTDPDLRSNGGMMGSQIVDTNEVTKQAAALEPGQISEPIELDNGGFAIVKLYSKEPARRKTFEEAGAEVSNDYQDHISKALEKQWVDRIKQKYIVRQDTTLLKNAFTTPQASRSR